MAVAPLTTQRPWDSTTTTSFVAIVSSVSLLFGMTVELLPRSTCRGSLASPFDVKAPSVACGNSLLTLVRPVPQVHARTATPNYPRISMVYAPSARPTGQS